MPDLSEQIRDYVAAACPPLTPDDLRRGPVRSPKSSRPKTIVSVVGAVAIAAILAVALPVTLSSPRPDTAAAALDAAAQVAASQAPPPTPGRHQYLYYEVTGVSALVNTYAPPGQQPLIVREVETTQTWVAPNGSGRQYITSKDSPLLASQRAEWLAEGSRYATPPSPSDTVFPATSAGRQPVGGPMTLGRNHQWYLNYPHTSFPTQPAGLKRAIERFYDVKRGANPQTLFELAGDVLQVESPSIRAAIFQMIKQLPGVRFIGRTKDIAGRFGIGVAINRSGLRRVLIFDPETSAVLGEEAIATQATSFAGVPLPKGTLLGYATFGPIGVTSSVFATPKR